MCWRVKAAHYNDDQTGDNRLFWIAGVDYQFNNGTLFAAECYNNNRGANDEVALAALQADAWVRYGLQQQLSRCIIILMLDLASSLLHQINAVYLVSNEADLLLSILFANGKGLNTLNNAQSELGHIPTRLTVRLRFYF